MCFFYARLGLKYYFHSGFVNCQVGLGIYFSGVGARKNNDQIPGGSRWNAQFPTAQGGSNILSWSRI